MLQLHLNPIHAVVQLRPSLEQLKPSVSKRKSTVAADAEVTVKVEEPNDRKAGGPSTKQVITDYLDMFHKMYKVKVQNMCLKHTLLLDPLVVISFGKSSFSVFSPVVTY